MKRSKNKTDRHILFWITTFDEKCYFVWNQQSRHVYPHQNEHLSLEIERGKQKCSFFAPVSWITMVWSNNIYVATCGYIHKCIESFNTERKISFVLGFYRDDRGEVTLPQHVGARLMQMPVNLFFSQFLLCLSLVANCCEQHKRQKVYKFKIWMVSFLLWPYKFFSSFKILLKKGCTTPFFYSLKHFI